MEVAEYAQERMETSGDLTLPDRTDLGQIRELITRYEHVDVYGAKTLVRTALKYLRTVDICENQYVALKRSVATLNGQRMSSSNKGHKKGRQAQRFFENLSTSGLRLQCQSLDVDYDAYDSQEEIVAVLVEKYVAMT